MKQTKRTARILVIEDLPRWYGRYDDHHSEASGLGFADGGGTRSLTARDLRLVAVSVPYLVFLSCCQGAVTKSQPASGEFCGTYHALAQVDFPTVVSPRWVGGDAAAPFFATVFYTHLWRTLYPREVVFEVRREGAMGAGGLDNHPWTAPVMLAQSP